MDTDFLITTGQGVFETLRYEDGRLWFWEHHLQRLMRTLTYFAVDVSGTDFKSIVEDHIAQSGAEGPLRVKLLVVFPFDRLPKKINEGSIRVYLNKTAPLSDRPEALSLQTRPSPFSADYPLNPFKTINFGPFFWERYQAGAAGFDDVLFFRDGRLLETSVANLFAVKDGQLFTPPVQEGVLPGVIRQMLLNYLNAREQTIHWDNLQQYDYFFITNSLIELQPVKRVDRFEFEGYEESFARLLKKWRAAKETGMIP
ncbi:MAG TPA: hypothetical protein ENK44_13110 [Caldithrix abyssi]|uniref:branched-chain-amino-acid transaminase n=1 Tax=Caldithrix abyssi TaxID=187145 RepID=A0A7V4WWJ3_CALAY|nr:hypothetical protein [Caldithrix abyssi]